MIASAFDHFEWGVKRVNALFALLAAGLVLVVMIVGVTATLSRALGLNLLWAHDSAQVAFVYLVFLTLGPALQTGHHVSVELFETLIPARTRKYLDHVAAIACILFGAIFLKFLWQLTSRSFEDGRLAMAAIEIPLKWIQLAGPLGAIQFILTAIMNLGLSHRRLLAR